MAVETTGVQALTMEALDTVVLDQTVDLQEVLEGLMSRQIEKAFWEDLRQGITKVKDLTVGWVRCPTPRLRGRTHQCWTGR